MRTTILHNHTKKQALDTWNAWKRENNNLYKSLLKACSLCGKEEFLGIDHKDGNKMNNDLSNFDCLCWPCHTTRHMKEIGVRYAKPVIPVFEPEPEESWSIKEVLEEYVWDNKAGRWVCCVKREVKS